MSEIRRKYDPEFRGPCPYNRAYSRPTGGEDRDLSLDSA